jgi:hypothetical protein
VDPTAATTGEIVDAVLRCPSGALHFIRRDGGAGESPEMPLTVTPVRDGPLYLRGDIEIRRHDGTVMRHDTRAALCRCGRAEQMPFCDNTCRTSNWRE